MGFTSRLKYGTIYNVTGGIMIDLERIREDRAKCKRVDKLHGIYNHRINKESLQWILDDLGLGDCTIVGGNYFTTPVPFHIHTDNGKENEPDFNILIPITCDSKFSTILFDQTYSGYASHFRKGSLGHYLDRPVYNEVKYDFEGVENLWPSVFDEDMYMNYLTHMPYEWFDGLSVNQIFHWTLGSHLKFPCNQLHCSGNFNGVKEGLTLLCKNPS